MPTPPRRTPPPPAAAGGRGALEWVKTHPMPLAAGGGILAALFLAHKKSSGPGTAAPAGTAAAGQTFGGGLGSPYDSSGVDAYNSIETLIEGLSTQVGQLSQQTPAPAPRPTLPPFRAGVRWAVRNPRQAKIVAARRAPTTPPNLPASYVAHPGVIG